MNTAAQQFQPGIEDFDQFYAEKIEPEISDMEGSRRKAIRLFIILCAVGIVALATSFLSGVIFEGNILHALLLRFGCFAIGAAALFYGYVVYNSVHGPFQRALVGKVAAFLGLNYQRHGFNFATDRFVDAGLIAPYGRVKLEDHIAGEHRGIHFAQCEAMLFKPNGTWRGSAGGGFTVSFGDKGVDFDDDRQLSFRGLLLIYSFPKRYTGRTIVMSDDKWPGGNRATPPSDDERVHLEDPRFENRFNVYSSNQVEARYLLTPRFMECISELGEKLGRKDRLSLAFYKSDLLIAIRSKKDRFEGGGLFSSFADKKRVEQLLEEFSMLFDIIDTLELSRRQSKDAL